MSCFKSTIVVYIVLFLLPDLHGNNRTVVISPKTKNWTLVFTSEINKQIASDKHSDTLFVEFAEGVYPLQQSYDLAM